MNWKVFQKKETWILNEKSVQNCTVGYGTRIHARQEALHSLADNKRGVGSSGENETRMEFLRSHLCHPFRAYFTCRIAAYLTCQGCNFPGKWIEFGRTVELKIILAARWLGIQVASLERNLRSSGFRLISSLGTQKIRVYAFPCNKSDTSDESKVGLTSLLYYISPLFSS